MTGRRLYVITAAMMLSLFLASIEVTVVATAMPTIVAQLGGLEIYAWVFSAYMLASTTAVPVFGKLSDIYGRRPIYLAAIAVFMIGSALAGQAQTMPQLVIFRGIQGLGAGGLLPLAFTIIGDIFTFEQRAKMQGVFSSVWGVSSVIGPLIGGFLVDQVSWHWIFYLNIPFGLIAAALMILAWRDVSPRAPGQVDLIGAGLLSGGVIALLLAMFELNSTAGWNAAAFWSQLALAMVLLGVLLWFEARAPNPILPLPLFRERLFATASAHGFWSGFALFGSASFIPFFVETVLGTSATAAGAALTPQLIAWVLASMVGSRLLLRVSYRSLAMVGMTSLVIGASMMTQVGVHTPYWLLGVNVALMGMGMGLSIPSFLIAVQSTVPRQSLGTATATVQFARSIGGTVGVSVMGVILAVRLAAGLASAGLDPNSISLNGLIDAAPGSAPIANLDLIRVSLASAVQSVFVVAFIASILAWVVTFLSPRGRIGARAPAAAVRDASAEDRAVPAK
ncbi:MAG: MFS transporter [Chloroflexi bacterium]|nr:MFS transporter [Chloroflexota bacterium]